MVYTPGTDFVALWRNQSGGAARAEMPTLDFVLAAFVRAGLLNVHFGDTEPTSNQPVTMWFKPAVPSNVGEGALFLWNATTSAYNAATPTLFAKYLTASEALV